MRGFLFTSNSSPSHSSTHSPARTPVTTPSHRRTFSASLQEEDLLYAEQVIKRWDLDSPFYSKLDYLFTGDRRQAREFIKSVNNLQSAMHLFVSESASSEKIIHAQKLMQVAMKRLEKEFYQMLSANRDVLDSESVSNRSSRARSSVSDDDNASEEDDRVSMSGTTVSDGDRVSVSEMVMADLKSIADCMIGSGYGKECVKIYKILRKSIVDETLYNLGVEKYSLNQLNKMDWEVLEPKIKTWLYAEKIAVRSLFSGERILCDYVFSSSEKIRESCFSEICKERAIALFEFPEFVAKSKKSMDRMFRTLDMYSAISDQWSEIEMIFSFEFMAAVRTQVVASYVKLGDAVRTMLTDFEAAMQKEILKTPVVSGGIHPLTRYVMNYLVFLSDYSEALSDILADWPLEVHSPLPESYISYTNSDESSSISARFAWLVLVLLCKIDAGAELYKDVAQSYLFLVNNLNYVVSKVRNSNLRLLIGEDWLVKHEQKVKQYAGNYERMAWSKVVTSLPTNTTVENLPIESARDCFRRFNLEFNDACRKQSTWIISDSKLRDDIKISLSKRILPAYRRLYEGYRGCFQGVESVVKYAPDDLGNYLSNLFHGTGTPGSAHSSSSTLSRSR
ncbi:putative exocyst complex component Exo70, cullin repeat-like-containing domain superfamily [Helianthus annuus]|nr:putative exocyst complex component Exo70, cullin repeat-like-containing domain superfamily [Helianthus annuus]KAJ0782773.1 putative exocyst complex component Exo70, cullin repeat-like-containing domain superfamily [Helianthus annuus]KAJ0956387.1 putative exocyst complex component Exo70, cullin repeat-like-containing domain superfamily [Helianthus annuus]